MPDEPLYAAAVRVYLGTGTGADRDAVLAYCRGRYAGRAPAGADVAAWWVLALWAQARTTASSGASDTSPAAGR